MFESYFDVFPWDLLAPSAVGEDIGCGSGRWARCVAPRVGTLHCVDASEAAVVAAQKNLSGIGNCQFHVAAVADLPFAEATLDFAYSLGVLHHLPDAWAGLRACVRTLNPGAPSSSISITTSRTARSCFVSCGGAATLFGGWYPACRSAGVTRFPA